MNIDYQAIQSRVEEQLSLLRVLLTEKFINGHV